MRGQEAAGGGLGAQAWALATRTPLLALLPLPGGRGQAPPLERLLGWLVRALEGEGSGLSLSHGTSRAPAALGEAPPSQEVHRLPHRPVGPRTPGLSRRRWGRGEAVMWNVGRAIAPRGPRFRPVISGQTQAASGEEDHTRLSPNPKLLMETWVRFWPLGPNLSANPRQRPVCAFRSATAGEGMRERLGFWREDWLPVSAPHLCCLQGAGRAFTLSGLSYLPCEMGAGDPRVSPWS